MYRSRWVSSEKCEIPREKNIQLIDHWIDSLNMGLFISSFRHIDHVLIKFESRNKTRFQKPNNNGQANTIQTNGKPKSGYNMIKSELVWREEISA